MRLGPESESDNLTLVDAGSRIITGSYWVNPWNSNFNDLFIC